jgi:hypothetical protein
LTDKPDDLFGLHVALLHLPVHLDARLRAGESSTAPMTLSPIVPFPTAQRGRTAPPGPIPAAGRLEHEAAFI